MPSINVKFTDEEFETLKNCKLAGESWRRYMPSSAWIKGRLCDNPKKEWHPSWGIEDDIREKPCRSCGFCPYGQIVEMFPFQEPRDDFSCRVFGHNCPVFYLAEPFVDTFKLTGHLADNEVIADHPEPIS